MAQDVIVLTEQELMTSLSLKKPFLFRHLYIYFNLLNCMTIKQGCSILTTAPLNDVSGQ